MRLLVPDKIELSAFHPLLPANYNYKSWTKGKKLTTVGLWKVKEIDKLTRDPRS